MKDIVSSKSFYRIRLSSHSGIIIVGDVSNMQVLLEMMINDLMVINGIIVTIRLMKLRNLEGNEQNAIT